MTDIQKRFCEEYVVDYHITNAAKRAGYQGDNVNITGWQVLQEPECKLYIEQLKEIQQQRTFVTAERVQREISRLAFSDLRDYYDDNGFLKLPKDLSDDAAAALAGIEIDELWGIGIGGEKEKLGETKKVKLYDKMAALDKLARRLGMFEKDNDQSKPINVINFQPIVNTNSPPLSENEK